MKAWKSPCLRSQRLGPPIRVDVKVQGQQNITQRASVVAIGRQSAEKTTTVGVDLRIGGR